MSREVVMKTRLWLGLVLVGLVACDAHPSSRAAIERATTITSPDEPEVELVSAQSRDDAMIGVLVPRAEIVLVSSGFARLRRLDVEVGDRVGEGDVVASMDVRGDRNDLAMATAAWKASQAELDRFELELEKARATRSDVEKLKEFVSKAELREQRFAEKLTAARRRSAGALLEEQRSKMEDASQRIAEAELRAPFSGSISRRYVDPGATLVTGDPVVRIMSDERLVRFAVPEERSGGLRLGLEVEVRFEAEGVEVSGEISTITPEIDAGTRLLFVEATVELSEAQARALRVGAVVQVEVAPRAP